MLGIGNPITKQELTIDLVRKLAMYDPVIMAGIDMMEHGGLDMQESLILIVYSLHAIKENLNQIILENHKNSLYPMQKMSRAIDVLSAYHENKPFEGDTDRHDQK